MPFPPSKVKDALGPGASARPTFGAARAAKEDAGSFPPTRKPVGPTAAQTQVVNVVDDALQGVSARMKLLQSAIASFKSRAAGGGKQNESEAAEIVKLAAALLKDAQAVVTGAQKFQAATVQASRMKT